MRARDRLRMAALAGSLLGFAAMPLQAHHAATMFDGSKTVIIKGTIKTYEWTNPHVWIWIDVPEANGQIQTWGIETANLAMARRLGMTRDSFKPGDQVTMSVNPMKDGSIGGRLRQAVFEDGHSVVMTPSESGGPPPPS